MRRPRVPPDPIYTEADLTRHVGRAEFVDMRVGDRLIFTVARGDLDWALPMFHGLIPGEMLVQPLPRNRERWTKSQRVRVETWGKVQKLREAAP